MVRKKASGFGTGIVEVCLKRETIRMAKKKAFGGLLEGMESRIYIYSLLIFIGLSGSAYADVFQGKWVCEEINVGNTSRHQYVYTISGNNLHTRHLELPLQTEYFKIYTGKINSFVVFVEDTEVKGDYSFEEVVVLNATKKKNKLQLSRTATKPNFALEGSRMYGICNKI